MEYLIIVVLAISFLSLLFFILEIKIKKVKELGENKELNELTNSFPENLDICQTILKKLGNTSVTIKEEKEARTSLYIIATNTISIANIRDNFMRIQTIAHECLHSVQNKKILWFNFLFTNFYLLYFLGISVLTIFKIIPNPMLYLAILLLFSIIQYSIRSLLETDAMIKAKYVAKEYIQDNQICAKEDCQKIIHQYDKMNTIGIPFVNFDILARNLMKVIVYALIACIF